MDLYERSLEGEARQHVTGKTMTYQQYQPQQPGLGQGFQQTELSQQAPLQPSQQLTPQFSTAAPQGGLLTPSPATQQSTQTPQSATATSQMAPQPLSQQLPAYQSPVQPAQQPLGQFQQGGQFGTIPQSVPQTGFAQSPQQTAGQQLPTQAQAGQASEFGPTGSGQTPAGQAFTPGAQSIPSQATEGGSVPQPGEQGQSELVGTPSIDMVDMPDEIVLFVDLPGYKEDDIKIQADGQNLNISAERRDEDEQQEGQRFTRERPKKLQRMVRLPSQADVNAAEAAYEDGVCKITLPKMEEEKQHEIAFQ